MNFIKKLCFVLIYFCSETNSKTFGGPVLFYKYRAIIFNFNTLNLLPWKHKVSSYRTRKEIDEEIYAMKAMRGDFDGLTSSSQPEEIINKFRK
jgi:hypothetical protein